MSGAVTCVLSLGTPASVMLRYWRACRNKGNAGALVRTQPETVVASAGQASGRGPAAPYGLSARPARVLIREGQEGPGRPFALLVVSLLRDARGCSMVGRAHCYVARYVIGRRACLAIVRSGARGLRGVQRKAHGSQAQ